MAIYDNGLNPALPGYDPAKVAAATRSTSSSTTPNTISSTPLARSTTTSSGGSGGQFTQFVKAPNNATVYGKTSDGRWVAFETGDQFTGSGGQWNQIQTVANAPTGAVNYSQWKAAAPAPTTSPTSDLVNAIKQVIVDRTAQGYKINPNIELTPEVIKQFLDQATNEISPYYAGQMNAIKDQLNTHLDQLQQNYQLQKQNQEASFKQNLLGTRENLAAGGAAYSGFRGQQEQQLQQGVDRSLTGLGLQTASSANDAVAAARKAIGSEGVAGATLPTFQGYNASLSGQGSFTPTRTLDFNNFSAPLQGDLQYNQAGDIRNLTDYLKQQEVNKRVLSF